MTDASTATFTPGHGMDEERDRLDEAIDRARYFERKHGIRERLALAAAYRQMGFTASGIANRIGSNGSTVKAYVDELEELFGKQAVMPKVEANRTGPLNSGVSPTGVGPDDASGGGEAFTLDVAPELDSGDPRSIPGVLLKREQWMCRNGKVPKAPWRADGVDRHATDNSDPLDESNWTDFETADAWASKMPGWGVSFVFAATGDLCGIDLDGCRDPETGGLSEFAQGIVERADAFTEVSPSGTGLHIYVTADLDPTLNNTSEDIELYDHRQFTVTGRVLDGYADRGAPERQDLVDELAEEYMRSGETDRRGQTTGDYETEYDDAAFSPFDELEVIDLYPGLPTGTNVEHPIHGSTSDGGNFRISANDPSTATCWRGSCCYGEGDGCGLNAQQLLAMRVADEEKCSAIREQWADDDELVFKTWLHAVEHDHLDLDPSPPPWRALKHVASEHSITGLEEGGPTAQAVFRIIHRIIRVDYGVEVEFDE